MRRAIAWIVMFTLVLPATAWAHVTVQPRQSTPGAEERYTVRVPTEGAVTTTSLHLEIPDGVTVLGVDAAEGATFETEKQGDRIVGITWSTEIKPKEASEFSFRARNPPGSVELTWKARQHYADGTATDWVGPAGDRRPAAVTTLQ